MVPLARAIGADDVGRYQEIPRLERSQACDLMVAFTRTVADPDAARLLELALRGRGAFSRFKRVLSGDAALRQLWFSFQREASMRRAREWLASMGIEGVNVGPGARPPRT